jgi:adenine-specific DNA-methyltransferase
MGRRYIGIESGNHAAPHCVERVRKVIAGEQGGISASGGSFQFYTLDTQENRSRIAGLRTKSLKPTRATLGAAL